MMPDFRYLVGHLRKMPQVETIIDRCNLTILLETGYEWLADFLVVHRVKIVASMPCYELDNVDAQRGDGVFDSSIRALQLLNRLGYGRMANLPLDLVYNPNGPFYRLTRQNLKQTTNGILKKHFDIDFHRLYTLTNMPIGHFASWLKHNGKLEAYMRLLIEAFNPASVAGLMCQNTLSVGWRGEVYDCDFNQRLGMRWRNGAPLFLWDLDPKGLEGGPIAMDNHCFGCTAGSGSSCSGALVIDHSEMKNLPDAVHRYCRFCAAVPRRALFSAAQGYAIALRAALREPRNFGIHLHLLPSACSSRRCNRHYDGLRASRSDLFISLRLPSPFAFVFSFY